MIAQNLSTALATHVAHADFTQLSAATVLATKRAILDGMGVMLAASGLSKDVQPFISLAREQSHGGASRILGHGDRVSASLAALANGAMAHALDFEDAFDTAAVHPNASLLPAALAIAQHQSQAHAPVTGRDFITAVATGCDLACRMALALRQPLETGGWYPPPILGAFGAVAATARLLKLSPDQTRDAFSLLLCQNTCPGEIKYSAHGVIRAVREAFPAQAAVTSALLAAKGVSGFAEPLEGKSGFYSLYADGKYEPDDLLRSLGTHNWIEQLSFKPWPCCRGTHAYIEAAQLLRARHDFTVGDIVALQITGGEVQRMLCEPYQQKCAPQTLIDAKFSIPFTVATALLHDHVTLRSFTMQTLHDAATLKLASCSRFELRADWGRDRAASGELGIVLTDGRNLHCAIPQALGHPTRPLDDIALTTKFIDCVANAAIPMSADAATQLIARIMQLEHESDVSAVFT